MITNPCTHCIVSRSKSTSFSLASNRRLTVASSMASCNRGEDGQLGYIRGVLSYCVTMVKEQWRMVTLVTLLLVYYLLGGVSERRVIAEYHVREMYSNWT